MRKYFQCNSLRDCFDMQNVMKSILLNSYNICKHKFIIRLEVRDEICIYLSAPQLFGEHEWTQVNQRRQLRQASM